jgi:DNA-binding phage protein
MTTGEPPKVGCWNHKYNVMLLMTYEQYIHAFLGQIVQSFKTGFIVHVQQSLNLNF